MKALLKSWCQILCKRDITMEEKEIDLKDLCSRIIRQWKWMLIFGIFFAILFSGYQYIKDSQKLNQEMTSGGAETDTRSAQEIQDTMTADEVRNVSSYMTIYDRLYDLQQVRTTSILHQINPYDEKVLQLTYVVEIPDLESDEVNGEALIAKQLSDVTKINQLGNIYSDFLQSEAMIQAITGATDNVSEQELYALTSSRYDQGIVYYQLVYTEDMNIASIAEIVKSEMEKYSKEQQVIINHSCMLTNESYVNIVDEDLATTQYNVVNRIYSLQSQLNALENGFDNVEKEYIKAYLGEQSYLDIDIDDSASSQNPIINATDDLEQQSPTISIKMAAIGCVIGILLVCIWVVVGYLFSGTIHKAEDVVNYYHLPLFGVQIVSKDGTTNTVNSVKSKRVLHRHSKVLTPEEQKEIILSGVRLYCQQHDVNKIAFTGTEIEQIGDEYLNEIKKSLQESGICATKEQNFFYYPEALQRVSEIKNVVLFEIVDYSLGNEIDNILMKAEEYNIDILGAVVLEKC